MTNTKQTNVRLSVMTRRQLDTLTESTGMSQSGVIQTAIDRMFQQKNLKMKQIIVRQEATENGMFSGDWSGVDMDASAEKFVDVLHAAIKEQHPDANVTVEAIDEPTMDPVVIDGFDYQDRDWVMSNVEDIINRTYQDDATWVVYK
jgi:predicted DNA-binding protein